jgi:NAD(P)-dependent dehydrogenase (short-subunit alcohol dehydrogenase family)
MTKRPLSVAVLGATSGMGRALARKLAQRGDRVFVLGIDRGELERTAADLRVYAGGGDPHAVQWAECDLMRPETFGPALAAADRALGGLDTVVVTAALFATQEQLENDPALAARLLTADFTNTVLFCEEAKRLLLAKKDGAPRTLCVFSSVAGDRGRKPVILYGASKAGLSRYLEGLDHKHHADGLRVVTVKPGFVKTGMTAGLKPPPFAGEPDEVAARVVKAIDRGEPVVYAPAPWRAVMGVIKGMPRFVMRRVGF